MDRISEYLYRKASINKIPLNGTFELSPVCNFSCKMCYVRRTPAQIEKDGKRLRTWTEWLELAKECREEGMLYLLLTGGEPFIYPHFRELYMELHRMGFLISINTNGTMIDEKTVEWLKDAAPYRVNITLYGTSADTYERICGNRDGYERAVKAILMLKEAGIQTVINVSMIPQNAQDMEGIIQFGKEHDVITRVSTYMFPPVRREREETDSRFTAEEAAEMSIRKQRSLLTEEEFCNWKKYQLEGIRNAEISDECEGDKDATWGENLEYMRCRAGRSTFWVSWDGRMTACGMVPFPKEAYPFEAPFHECWMEITDAVRTTKVMEECNTCGKKKICRPCVAMLHSETGDVMRKAPYMCEMTDHIIRKIQEELQEEAHEEK